MIKNNNKKGENFADLIGKKAQRKIKAKETKNNTLWYALGMSGVVGWSIILPTMLGLSLGIWVDQKFSSSYSWTLMGLFIGIFLGCCNTWYWLEKQRNK